MASLEPEASQPSSLETQSRPGYSFLPDMWRDRVASNITLSQDKLEWYDRELEMLKSKVVDMLKDTSSDAGERIKLIDILCRLGISYHFQAEIERQLNPIFYSQSHFLENKDYDLYTVAVVFRVFRQHGIKMSCDIFNKFKDGEEGNFKDSITDDPKGLLSLFEAAHLSTHGEEILEEALAFSRTHLEDLAQSKPDFAEEITKSLTTPLQRGPPRVKAREFISFYEKHHEHYEPRDHVLLKFAKLDFNRVQLLHQQEIKSIYKWSNELDLASKLPLSRDRTMEFFYWSCCTYFEPKYACAREKYTKVCYLITFLDDVYDTYGAFDDLPLLTNAMNRWDRSMIDGLPTDYMKHLYKAFLDTLDEFGNDAAGNGTTLAVSFTRDYLKEFARVYMQEAEWIKNRYLPSFKESVALGIMSGGKHIIPAATFVGMGELTLQAFQWLENDPGLAKAVCEVVRLISDVVSHKREEQCENFINPYSSYQREYKSSDEETVEEFERMISSGWKTVNEQLMSQSASIPVEIMMRVINYIRIMVVFYKQGDAMIETKSVESLINTLYFDPIILE